MAFLVLPVRNSKSSAGIVERRCTMGLDGTIRRARARLEGECPGVPVRLLPLARGNDVAGRRLPKILNHLAITCTAETNDPSDFLRIVSHAAGLSSGAAG
jgi:hypothetical protein